MSNESKNVQKSPQKVQKFKKVSSEFWLHLDCFSSILVLTIPDGNWWKFKSSLERNEKSWWKSGFLEFSEWSCALDLTNISPFFRPIRIGFEVAQSGQNCQIGFFRNVDGEDDWGLFDRIWCLPQKCTSSFLRVSNGLRLGFCAFLCIFQVNVGNNDTLKKKKKKKIGSIRGVWMLIVLSVGLEVDVLWVWCCISFLIFGIWNWKCLKNDLRVMDFGLRGPRGRVWIELNC